MKIRVVDSHDQTQRRQVGAMIMRLACLNGMVSMAENTSLSQLHTQSAEPERIGKVAATWPELLLGDAAKMQAMREVKVSRHRAIDFYSDHVASHKTRIGMTLNKSMLNRIVGIHDSYSALNDSAYHVYNVLTHLSTHVESRSCVNKKQLVMEDKIGSIIKGDAFKQLVFA